MKQPIKLPWIKFSESGGNKRGHWRTHEAHRKSAIDTGYTAALNYDFQKRNITKTRGYEVRIVIKPPTNRYADWDNIVSGLKYYQDGICKALEIDDNQISLATVERGLPIKGGSIWYFIE